MVLRSCSSNDVITFVPITQFALRLTAAMLAGILAKGHFHITSAHLQ